MPPLCTETKNQFARDDPAFLALLTGVLLLSSLAFGLVMRLAAWPLAKFVLWVVLVDCVATGLAVATLYWAVANGLLLTDKAAGRDVEWAYCFDVHLNAFLPLVTVLHVFQLPFIMSKDFLFFGTIKLLSIYTVIF